MSLPSSSVWGPFTRVPTKTGEDVGGTYWPHHTAPERHLHRNARACTSLPAQIGRLEYRHIQSRGHQPFPFPTPPAASAPMLVTRCLTRSGVSIRVWCSPIWGGRGQTPSADCSTLGPWWPSAWAHCPSMAYGSCLGPLPNPRGSPVLLRCTPHQLAG